MASIEDINEIFERITEAYEVPVPIGGRCEGNVYYRVEYLSESDLNLCAEYVAERLIDLIAPQTAQVFLKLPGGYTFFAERLRLARKPRSPRSSPRRWRRAWNWIPWIRSGPKSRRCGPTWTTCAGRLPNSRKARRPNDTECG